MDPSKQRITVRLDLCREDAHKTKFLQALD